MAKHMEELFLRFAERVSLGILIGRPVKGEEVVQLNRERKQDEEFHVFINNNRYVLSKALQYGDRMCDPRLEQNPAQYREKKLIQSIWERLVSELEAHGVKLNELMSEFNKMERNRKKNNLAFETMDDIIYLPFDFGVADSMWNGGIDTVAEIIHGGLAGITALSGNLFAAGAICVHVGKAAQSAAECMHSISLPQAYDTEAIIGRIGCDGSSEIIKNIGRVLFKQKMQEARGECAQL